MSKNSFENFQNTHSVKTKEAIKKQLFGQQPYMTIIQCPLFGKNLINLMLLHRVFTINDTNYTGSLKLLCMYDPLR